MARLLSICIMVALLVLYISLLPGCSSLMTPRTPPVLTQAELAYFHDEIEWECDDLAFAFRSYWLDLYRGRVDQAWEREAPFFRYLADRGVYQAFRIGVSKNTLERIIVTGVVERGPRARQVRGRIVFSSGSGKSGDMQLIDDWVQVQGTWYHVYRNPRVFPFTK